MSARHRNITKNHNWKLWIIQHGAKCHYCNIAIDRVSTDINHKATIDHLIPRSRGGSNATSNWVWCCERCNKRKGNFIPVFLGDLLK